MDSRIPKLKRELVVTPVLFSKRPKDGIGTPSVPTELMP